MLICNYLGFYPTKSKCLFIALTSTVGEKHPTFALGVSYSIMIVGNNSAKSIDLG